MLDKGASEATKIQDRMVGLLKDKKPRALLIHTRFGIHTIGMRFPIDVLILDKHHKVMATKQCLKPYRIFLWNPKYSTVLELPAGTIERSKTELNDEIRIMNQER